MNALVQSGHMVQLSGTVTGGQVAGFNVQFTGAVTGSATTDSSGNYSYTTSQATLGIVSAVGTNQLQRTTDAAQATVAVTAPVLSMSISYGSHHSVTLSGILTDIDAGNQNISISGVVVGTPVTDINGNFSLTADASSLGAVNATETDLWGQVSDTATVMVTDSKPVIQNFTATHGIGNMWSFDGSVVAGFAPGLTVQFGGLDALAGRTAIVQADGTFHLTCSLPAGTVGNACAITTDWWGLDSDPAFYPLA